MTPEELFDGDTSRSHVDRVAQVQRYLRTLVSFNEQKVRVFLKNAVMEGGNSSKDSGGPTRAGRRIDLLLAALDPVSKKEYEQRLAYLVNALAVMVGPEAFIVTRDVCGLSDKEAQDIMDWAVRTLSEAALSDLAK